VVRVYICMCICLGRQDDLFKKLKEKKDYTFVFKRVNNLIVYSNVMKTSDQAKTITYVFDGLSGTPGRPKQRQIGLTVDVQTIKS